MIESSFATQYGIRRDEIVTMEWGEFITLLSGIMPKTPLGQIVSIRSEENKDILKGFNSDQHKIRNSWRNKVRRNVISNMTEKEKEEKIKEAQEMFKNMCG